MPKILTQNLTTLDVIKAVALLIMVIDHVGLFLYPAALPIIRGDDHLWLRAIGRIGLPVWFFLAGYSRSRLDGPTIWVWASVLLAAFMTMGLYVFPLNALFSMIFIRLLIGPLAKFAIRKNENLCLVVVSLTVLFPLTAEYFEYGTLGFLIALLGYVIRNAKDLELRGRGPRTNLLIAYVVGVTCLLQSILGYFSLAQAVVSLVGMLIAFRVLLQADFKDYPETTRKLGPVLTGVIQFLGRRTMEIYAVHLIGLIAIGWALGLGYNLNGWFEWDWTLSAAYLHLKPGVTNP